MPEQQGPTSAVQDYLKTLHQLGGDSQRVSPQIIAQKLSVRAPSVTGMLKRLSEIQLVDYEVGKGATLTAKGVREARRVIRRHRLVELFLHNVLNLDLSEVDAEAEALEHAISPRLEKAIADYLGEPLEDPHGHPIPSNEGHLASRELFPLSQFKAGETLIIRELPDDEPDRLKRWLKLGLTPGAIVILKHHEPLDGLYDLEVSKKRIQLGKEGVQGILCQRK